MDAAVGGSRSGVTNDLAEDTFLMNVFIAQYSSDSVPFPPNRMAIAFLPRVSIVPVE